MCRPCIRALLTIAPFLLPVHLRAAEKADSAAGKAARDVLAKFDKGDPGGKVRMGALVELARRGPATVPVLVEALKKGPPSAREFAAQALVMFAEPAIRPALEQALDDPEGGVRIYAVQALSMLGRLERTERLEKMLKGDPNFFGVRPMVAAALTREDRPDPAALRKALADYDLRNLDTARVGEMAPDFTLTDFTGKAHRLSQFRGKKTVVLRFILYDY
jgi:hypothetical protein